MAFPGLLILRMICFLSFEISRSLENRSQFACIGVQVFLSEVENGLLSGHIVPFFISNKNPTVHFTTYPVSNLDPTCTVVLFPLLFLYYIFNTPSLRSLTDFCFNKIFSLYKVLAHFSVNPRPPSIIGTNAVKYPIPPDSLAWAVCLSHAYALAALSLATMLKNDARSQSFRFEYSSNKRLRLLHSFE